MSFSTIIRYGTIVMALAGVVGITSVLRTIKAQENEIPPPPNPPPAKPFSHGVAATGILEAWGENVSIGAPISGLVVKIPPAVQVNSKVKKSDILFLLDDRDLKAQLVRQKAAIAVAKANVDVAKAQLVKVQDMLRSIQSVRDQRAISQDDLRNRTNDVAVSQAQMAAAEAQLTSAEADVTQTEMLIDRLTVRAPRNATVLQLNIREGEFVAPTNRTAPMVLGDLTYYQVRADIDEQNAIQVRAKQNAKANLKGDSTRSFPLEFVRIEPYVIPKVSLTGASTERVDTRVLQVIFRLKAPEGQPIYVGQQVDVFIDG